MKKIALSVVLGASILFIGSSEMASAISIEDLKLQLQAVLNQAKDLEAQINAVPVKVEKAVPVQTFPDVTLPITGFELVEPVAISLPPIAVCRTISHNLFFGRRDAETSGQVSELQRFLKERGHFTYPEITGFFGPATQTAVERFQAAEGVVSSGSPDSTGYGAVGPRTRAAIEKRDCNDDQKDASLITLSPNGGEQFDASDDIRFRWETNYIPKDPVAFLYSPILGNVYEKTPSFSRDGDAYVDFFPGSAMIPNGQYKVNVCDEGTPNPQVPFKPLCDISDNYFHIGNPDLPSVEITSPTLGDVWEAGNQYFIEWKTINSKDETVSVSFVSTDTTSTEIYGIGKGFISDGKWTWTIPSNIPEGEYQLRFCLNGDINCTLLGLSFPFKIVNSANPYIEVFSPNNGVDLKFGKTYEIKWNASGFANGSLAHLTLVDATTEKMVAILTDSNPASSLTPSVNMTAGSHMWKIYDLGFPDASKKYKIKITCSNSDPGDLNCNNLSDISDIPFSIAAPGWVKITSPKGGDVWEFGKPQTITWESEGVQTVSLYLTWPLCKIGMYPASLGKATYTAYDGMKCSGFVKPITAGKYGILAFTELQSLFYGQGKTDGQFTIINSGQELEAEADIAQ